MLTSNNTRLTLNAYVCSCSTPVRHFLVRHFPVRQFPVRHFPVLQIPVLQIQLSPSKLLGPAMILVKFALTYDTGTCFYPLW